MAHRRLILSLIAIAGAAPLTPGGFRGRLAELAIDDERLAPDHIAAHYAAR